MIDDADVPAETVRAFAAHVMAAHGATLARTPGWLRSWLSVQGGDPDHYAVTIGRTVYMPIEVGATVAGWSAWEQVSVIAHECQHVYQGETRSMLARALDYALSTARRTETECQAFAAQLELEMWRRGVIAPWWPGVRASALRAYHVSDADLLVAERYLRALAPTVRRSGYVTHAGRVAIRWLDQHAPELRHPSVPSRSPS